MSSQKKIKVKTIEYLGAKYNYISPENLASKIKVSKSTAERLIKDYKNKKTDRYITFGNSDIVKINLKKPLIAQQFSLPMTNNKLITGGKSQTSKVFTKGVKGVPVNISIFVKFKFKISKDIRTATTSVGTIIDPSKINDTFIKGEILESYFGGIEVDELEILNYKITSQHSNQTLKLKDMKLFFQNPVDISNKFSNVIHTQYEDCVVDFLKDQYPKLSKKKIEKLRTIEDIKTWSIANKINLSVYDIESQLIDSHRVEKSKLKSLNYIAFDNHLYPMKNKKPQKKNEESTLELIENAFDKFIEIMKNGFLPSNINFYCDTIKAFEHDGIYYFENPDYNRCKEILEMFKEYDTEDFKIMEQLSPFTTLNTIGDIIAKTFVKQNINSFLPEHNKFVKGGFNYNNENLEAESNFITIDKNKCHTSNLYDLPYLISSDIRTSKHTLNPTKIEGKNLYIIRSTYSTVILPDTNIYWGQVLILARNEGVEFELLEELETETHENYFVPMIDALKSKVTKLELKTIMNIFIGKLESCKCMYETFKFRKICGVDEAKRTTGDKIPICINSKKVITFQNKQCTLNLAHEPSHYIIRDTETKFKLYTKKPIAIQIKDSVRVQLYKMMKALDLNTNDIKQIKTDSITFKNSKSSKLIDINNKLSGWKLENYSEISSSKFVQGQSSFEYDVPNNDNYLFDCYAGAGKTHLILNDFIPKLDSYIVLTPSHASIKDYRKAGKNCKVIQSYDYGAELPTENNIIIDEVGMVDSNGWNTIYKLYLLGKRIMAFGDFNQLLPVTGKSYNKPLFINKIFTNQIKLQTNHRNNFTRKYYENLMGSRNKSFMVDEILKHNTPYQEASVIICYRNATVKKYNEIMTRNLGIKNKFDRGAKIKCNCNNKKLTELGIYNNFDYVVLSKDNEGVLISDGVNEIYVPVKHSKDSKDYYSFNKKFDYAYAKTIYGVQGSTLDSIHYALDDMDIITARATYTAISRLRQKLEQPQIDHNENNKFVF
tara:strand:+ start:157 stop:3156 length:3000 start_codon:yes stop_codon:yes gene_type:complete